MKKIRKYYQTAKLGRFQFFLIGLLALLLRLLNPTYGYPVLYAVADEVNNYAAALYMISEKTLIAHQTVYPPLGAYIQVPFMVATYGIFQILKFVGSYDEFVLYLLTYTGAMLFISRLLSAFFGIATIYVLFRFTKELFPKKIKIALWSAFLLTTSINHVIISHFGRPWSPALFFYLLSALYFFRSIKVPEGRQKNIWLGTIFAILTEGFLQIGFFVWLLFGCLLVSDRSGRQMIRAHTLLLIVSFFFYAGSAQLLHSLKIIPAMTQSFIIPLLQGNSISILNYIYHHNTLGYYIYQALTTEPIIIIGFLLSVIWLRKRHRYNTSILLFSLIYIAVLAYGNRHFARYLLPILVLMIPYVAWVIVALSERIKSIKLLFLFYSFLIVMTVSMPIRWNYLFLQIPTFIQAADYIKQKISPEVPIASISRRYSLFEPGIQAISAVQKYHPTYYRQLQNKLQPEIYPPNTRNIYYLDQLGWNANTNIYAMAKQYQVKYIISGTFQLNHSFISAGKQFKRIALFSPTNNENSVNVADITIDAVEEPLPLLLWYVNRPGYYVEIWEVL